MFYENDKLIAVDEYQMVDGEKCLTLGKAYTIEIVHYKDLSFSITGDDGIEIIIEFKEAEEYFDLKNIIQYKD